MIIDLVRGPRRSRRTGRKVDFDRVLKEVLWCLVTEGSISYRRIKLNFGLDDDGLEELRRELIGIKRLAADVDGELLVWAPDGRAARPERRGAAATIAQPCSKARGRLPLPPIAICRAPSAGT